MKVIVIGGGPAGMMAAIKAKQEKNDVIIFEKMDSLGKKLLITGKGRCNITSNIEISEFIQNIPGNGKFLYSAFQNYNNKDIINFLEKNGLKTKVERGNRVFPVTDKAIDVLKIFLKKLKELDVKIITNAKVIEILQEDGKIRGIKYIQTNENNKEKIENAEKIILATGGKSYPVTGSTGDGYEIANKIGHTIKEIKPSLVPLESYDKNICKSLQGLSLKNVAIKVINTRNNKIIYEDFGEMLFTHYGVSGPIIISSSAHLIRYKDIDTLIKNHNIKLVIDLKPALTEEKLDLRILRDFEELKNKQIKNSLFKLLPQKLINPIIHLSKIDENKKINEITKEERNRLIKILKNFEIEISGFRKIEEAIITAGGVNIKEINPKTMESKIINGLYFAGEIIDVDAYTGGFNLQIAYSTGYTAGINQ